MSPSEVTELVCQHGLELLGRHSVQQRNADGKEIPRPAEYAEAWNLNDARVEAPVEYDLVDLGRTHIAAQTKRRLEEGRSLFFAKRDSYGRGDPHPERPHEHRCQGEERDSELQDELNEHGRRAGEEPENEQNG